MKTNPSAAILAALIALPLLVASRVHAQTTPTIPIGSLTVTSPIASVGSNPTMSWSINYPSVVKDYITITPPGTITTKQQLICDIRILGAGVTTQDSNGKIVYIRTAGKVRAPGVTNFSSWYTVFDGVNTDTIVKQQGILDKFKSLTIPANTKMDFGGQYYYNNSWYTFFTSVDGTGNVRALVNGDACPTYVPDYNAPSLETFLKGYLDASNKVRIGPMDAIIFMELTTTDRSDVGYDCQDMVFLVTFRTP
jgi:hypothetical protein